MGEQDHRRRFTDPDGCRDVRVRSHKEGFVEQVKLSTKIAGIDVSKKKLDVAGHGVEALTQVANDRAGFVELLAWLERLGVVRVGL